MPSKWFINRKRKQEVERRIHALSQTCVTRYNEYWESIKPHTDEERYKRWVYAVISPRIRFDRNSKAYDAVANGSWTTEEEVVRLIKNTGAGCHNSKGRVVWQLRQRLLNDDTAFLHTPEEEGFASWQDFRDSIFKQKSFLGVGAAVASFGMTMSYPLTAQVVKLDSHMRHWYGIKRSSFTVKQYRQVEDHFVNTCNAHGYPPAVVREILWDEDQNKELSQYWSYVFEQKKQQRPILEGCL